MTPEQAKEWIEGCPVCPRIAPGLLGWQMAYTPVTVFCSECIGRIQARGIGTQAMRNAAPLWADTFKGHACCSCCGKALRGIVAGLMDALRSSLPAWYFEPYGVQGAVACYPPAGSGGTTPEAFRALRELAPITSVCGQSYIVTQLESAVAVS